MDTDVLVIGTGLSGLVTATEAADAGARVLLLDQEGEQDLGGQAYWSFGGLFLIDSPEQRRMGVRDSFELARADWFGSAAFEEHDVWPRRWAEAYLRFAHEEKRAWLRSLGHRFFPVVGWAERGDGTATGHGNSVPRFHITWGTGPGVVAPFVGRLRRLIDAGRIRVLFRHRVDEFLTLGDAVVGARGARLAPDSSPRGAASTREVVGEFEFRASTVVIASGGIGADHDKVRANWPADLGSPPQSMVSGVPEYVDGRLLPIAESVGGRLINTTRMWHYTEGIRNWDPVWRGHGIRILPGPSSLWLDANGNRLPVPLFPGFDTRATLKHLRSTGADHSWFILNQRIIEKEFALSGSEQNPDLTGRSIRATLGRVRKGATAPVEAFKTHGEDFVVADSLEDLVAGMNSLTDTPRLSPAAVRDLIEARDAQVANEFGKDAQLHAIRQARNFLGDKLIRVAPVHPILEPAAGPLIAVRLHILTRKTLGGLHTDLDARVLDSAGQPVPGLYAAGEAAGFGGGGMHGFNSLEGTFLGGCLFSGRVAGRAAAAAAR
ncbi:FAD-binding dehydrogenase [Brevibacterium daeguense]|uniref:FAD-binding dehydrogenase n=1 Tax=Brevibacterium daeguense TaxID=909936 RepID=A0ABP8EJJ8_9MICO|nr:FAD-binding dehydrogenase [Brevibacterium daeguense]